MSSPKPTIIIKVKPKLGITDIFTLDSSCPDVLVIHEEDNTIETVETEYLTKQEFKDLTSDLEEI
jgi:hypothetical protein